MTTHSNRIELDQTSNSSQKSLHPSVLSGRSVAAILAGVAVGMILTIPAHSQNALKTRPTQPIVQNDNIRVVALMNKGFDDTIIVSKIKASNWSFQLDDEDMVALRKAGVSSKVVAVMLDDSVLSTAKVTIDNHVVGEDTLGQAKVAGRFLNNLTGDFTSLKEKAYLQGPVATDSASPMPEITVSLPKGQSIENYVLVQLDQKADRREIEIASGAGVENAKTGLRSGAVHATQVVAVADNTYHIKPLKPLKPGQYMVYVLGSADQRKDVYGKGYDFSVLR